jgi:hypothetical protein
MEFQRAIQLKNAISSFFLKRKQSLSRIISFGGGTGAAAINVQSDIKSKVNGVGVGEKANGESFIKVLTKDKLKVSPAALSQFYGVNAGDIKVEEVGLIRFRMPTRNHRPPFPGISVGHYRVTAGTLGCFVKDEKDKIYILSNNHVLANSNRCYWKDPILQPGILDGGIKTKDMIAQLSYYIPLERSVPNAMDAAIAEIIPELKIDHRPSAKHRMRTITDPLYGMKVEKYGRTTGHTKGKITVRSLDLEVDYDGYTFDFEDQFEIKGNRGKKFCDAGDSGALIFESGKLRPVGLLFAGADDGTTYATPIGEILSSLSVKIL